MFAYAGPYGKLTSYRVTNRFGAKVMSVLITLLVAGLVVIYLRSNRKARARWLQDLSLPGHWVSQREGMLSFAIQSQRVALVTPVATIV